MKLYVCWGTFKDSREIVAWAKPNPATEQPRGSSVPA
jgi:hypothetical protein